MRSARQNFLVWCAEKGIRPRRLGAVIGITIASGLLFVLVFGKELTHLSYDLLFYFRRGAGPEEVALVYINQKTYQDLGRHPDYTLSRRYYARLVDKLARAKPNVVVFDVLLSTTNYAAGEDDAFAEAIKRHGGVVLTASESLAQAGASAHITELQVPNERLLDAGAGLGHVDLDPDSDRCMRLLPKNSESAVYFAEVVAAKLGKRLPAAAGARWLNYYGAPENRTFTSYPLHLVLDEPGVAAETFRNKIVLVGERWDVGRAGQLLNDFFKTPYSRFGSVDAPGLEIHATALSNLLQGDALRILSLAPLLLAWGFIVSMFVSFLGRKGAIVTAALLALGALPVAIVLHRFADVFVPWVIPAFIQTPAALAARLVLNPRLRRVAFISYRREDSAFTQLILDRLHSRGRDAFVDVHLDPGKFKPQLKGQIERYPIFLLIVTDRTFSERIWEEQDVLRMEIRHALESGRVIISLLAHPFPPAASIPSDIAAITDYQSVPWQHLAADVSLHKLLNYMLRPESTRGATSPETVATPAASS